MGEHHHSRHSHGAHSHGAHSHGAHSHGAHSHGAHSHGADSHGADSHGAHSHGARSHGARSHGADSHGADSHGAHSHGTHSHGHSHASYAAYDHAGHVMLEIGGDVGALAIYTDPELLGVEIELSPAGEDGRRSHKEVLRRTLGQERHVAFFDRVTDGEYTLWMHGAACQRGVRVHGGEIAQLDWRAAAGGMPAAA